MAKKTEIQPYWRPDFRNPATLPDIKVVRTDFIVNGIALGVLLLALFLVGQRELAIRGLNGSLEKLQSEVQGAQAEDKASVALSGRFRTAGKSFEDLERFYQMPFRAHELLNELNALRAEELIFVNVNFAETSERKGKKGPLSPRYNVTLRGEVRGLTVLDDYVNALRDSEVLNVAGFTLKVTENPQQRNAETGLYPYTIQIVLAPGKNAKLEGAK